MATKIKLGNTPKTFKRKIEIININGIADVLEITYKYRTRRQFAALLDEQIAEAKAAPTPADDTSSSVAERVEADDAASAAAVMKIAEGWDLADDFSAESLAQLEDENPGALFAITQAYRAAVAEARTKN